MGVNNIPPFGSLLPRLDTLRPLSIPWPSRRLDSGDRALWPAVLAILWFGLIQTVGSAAADHC